MKRIALLCILVMTIFVGSSAETGLATNVTPQQESYFPDGIFDQKVETNNFIYQWYSKQLKALGEPSLYKQQGDKSKQIFRFIWLRTFHNPISIRLEVNKNDGSGTLYVKMLDGAGGYDPGKIKEDFKKHISKEDVNRLIKLLERENFWKLSTKGGLKGFDGAQWIIEGLQDGKYHLVDRWSPNEGVKDIGLFFLELSGLKVQDIY